MLFSQVKCRCGKAIMLMLAIVLFSVGSAIAQSWQWAKGAGGTGYDNSISIATDLEGNIYASGYFSSPSIVFGSTTLVNADSAGTADIFLVKYNKLGDIVWAKRAGGSAYDYAESVTTDVAGNIYIGGYFQSPTVMFDTFTLTNSGYGDVFLAKYDTSGNVVWVKSATGNYFDYANAVHCDGAGNVYMAGRFGSSVLTFDGIALNNSGAEDMFLVKYDPNGNVIWAKGAGGDGSDNAQSITTDVSGNVYIAGWFDGTNIPFGIDTLVNDSVGTADIFMVKYDSTGNIIWAKTAAGTGDAQAYSIVADAMGSIFLGGNFSSTFKMGGDSLVDLGGSSSDIFLAKFDTSANLQWLKQAGGSNADNLQSMALDAYDNVYIAGYYLSPTMTFGTITLTNAGYNDIFFAKYNTFGDVLSAKSVGGPNNDFGENVAIDTAGNVYMGGSYESATITFSTTTLTNAGGTTGTSDMFLAKYYAPVVGISVVSELMHPASVYPNPSTGVVTLTLTPGQEQEIIVYDYLGKEVLKQIVNTSQSKAQLDLHNQSSGAYFLHIISGSESRNIPFIISK